jgi:rubrerythrin
MDTQFHVFDILLIAEDIERRAAAFYQRRADHFADPGRKAICQDLVDWRIRHQQAWQRIRNEYSERTGEFGTFDPDNYVRSNPKVMAGLTCFGGAADSRELTGRETQERLIRDAIRRSHGVIIFCQGLKEFASNPESRTMIDHMIAEEERHIRLLDRSLNQDQAEPAYPPYGAPADSASSKSSRR